MLTETLDLVCTAPFWAALLRLATPLVFGTLGVLLCERAGVRQLGVEGIMVAGALAGWFTVAHGGGPWSGVAAAAVVGASFGALHGWLTVVLGLSQPLTGLAITLLASSGAGYAFRAGFPPNDGLPSFAGFAPMAWLPVAVLDAQTPLTLLALVAVGVVAWMLYRTPVGLAIRMTGENPRAAEAQGVSVAAMRIGAVVAGSALMGVAGACLVLAAVDGSPAFSTALVNGRGWLCLALVVFASFRPGRALLGAVLLAAIEAWARGLAQHGTSMFGRALPEQFFAMLPYLAAIGALAVVARRASYPRALMKPYRKGER